MARSPVGGRLWLSPVWGEVQRSLQLRTCGVGLIPYTPQASDIWDWGKLPEKKREELGRERENRQTVNGYVPSQLPCVGIPGLSSEWEDRSRSCSLIWGTSGEQGGDHIKGMNPQGHCSWHPPKRRMDCVLAIQRIPLPGTRYRKGASFKNGWFLETGEKLGILKTGLRHNRVHCQHRGNTCKQHTCFLWSKGLNLSF